MEPGVKNSLEKDDALKSAGSWCADWDVYDSGDTCQKQIHGLQEGVCSLNGLGGSFLNRLEKYTQSLQVVQEKPMVCKSVLHRFSRSWVLDALHK